MRRLLSPLFLVPSPPVRLRVALLVGGVLVGILLGGATPTPALGQERSGTRTPPDAEANLRVYPLTIWGPQAGVGVGAGLVVNDAFRDGSQALLTVAPSMRQQVATLSLASKDPLKAETFVLFDARVRRTDRQWFYGNGPFAEGPRFEFGLTSAYGRVRVGNWAFDRTLLVQPFVQLDVYNAFDLPIEASEASSTSATDASPLVPANDPGHFGTLDAVGRQTGARYGFDVAVDRRDRTYGATRGLLVQLSAFRYAEFTDAPVAYDRLRTSVHGFVPLGGRHRVALRGHLTLTNDRSDVDLPFYQRVRLDGRRVPGLDRDRYFGNDRLVLSAAYHFPLFTYADLATVEGHVGVHAASVYDDIGRQFDASVSLEDDLDARAPLSDAAAPLRGAASAGLRLGPIFRDETYFDLALGVSGEGVSAVRVTFRRPLTQRRPDHHR